MWAGGINTNTPCCRDHGLQHKTPCFIPIAGRQAVPLPLLEHIFWSDGPSHFGAVARALHRAAAGEVEYLAVRAPGGQPVAKLGID
jgi:hypothetical protein